MASRPDTSDFDPADLDDPSEAGGHGAADFASAQVVDAPTIKIRTIFRRFWPDTRPFRGRMLLSLALTGAAPAAMTVSIWLFKLLVDDVLAPADFRLFPPIAAAYLGITVLSGAVTYADEYLSAWVAERFVLGLRVRLFDHLGSLSVGFFEKRPLGDILSRLTSDVTSIEQMMLTGVNLVLTYSFQIVFYTIALLLLDWRLTLIALVAAPAFLFLSRVLSRRIARAAREMRRRSGSITSVAEESLANTALVQAYDRRATETERFRGENEASFRAGMRATRLEGLFGPVSSLVQAIGVLLVIGFAVRELATGHITLGGLLVFVTYLSQLYGPVAGFGGLANSMFAAGASAERIIEVLDTRPGVAEPEHPRPLRRATGALGVEDVDFGYPGTDRAALSGLSFRIPAGGRVAVVGASGAGKTTVTKLLLRFYDPDHGRITLDGRDLRDLPLSDLRANVTAVLQDTLVFDGTVEENIRWARPDATDDEIVAAARAADVHDFVTALPDGYRTRIGQRGRMLSGGQRQRLAIARAVIRDAPVLILDEPTTGLDAEATERVLAPLRRLMASRTTIIISHNLLTVTDADRILFLEGGELGAIGTHEELLRDSPGYARLYALHRAGGPAEQAPYPDPLEPETTRLPVVAHRNGATGAPVDPETNRLPVIPVLRTMRLPVVVGTPRARAGVVRGSPLEPDRSGRPGAPFPAEHSGRPPAGKSRANGHPRVAREADPTLRVGARPPRDGAGRAHGDPRRGEHPHRGITGCDVRANGRPAAGVPSGRRDLSRSDGVPAVEPPARAGRTGSGGRRSGVPPIGAAGPDPGRHRRPDPAGHDVTGRGADDSRRASWRGRPDGPGALPSARTAPEAGPHGGDRPPAVVAGGSGRAARIPHPRSSR